MNLFSSCVSNPELDSVMSYAKLASISLQISLMLLMLLCFPLLNPKYVTICNFGSLVTAMESACCRPLHPTTHPPAN